MLAPNAAREAVAAEATLSGVGEAVSTSMSAVMAKPMRARSAASEKQRNAFVKRL